MDVIGFALAQAVPATTVPAEAGSSVAYPTLSTLAVSRQGTVLLPSGLVFIVGGTVGQDIETQVFDPAAGTWTRKANVFEDLYDMGIALAQDGRVIVAGYNTSVGRANVLAWDPAANTWTAAGVIANMPTVRYGHFLVTLPDGKLFTAGGNNGSGNQSDARVLDLVANTWTTKASAPGTIMLAGAGVIGGIVYVAGGTIGGINNQPATYAYDPVANTWTTKANSPINRDNAATTVVAGKLLLAGSSSTIDNLVTVYDPVTNTWAGQGATVHARGQGGAAALADNTVILIGSNNTAGGAASPQYIAERYTPVVATTTKGRSALLAHLAAN